MTFFLAYPGYGAALGTVPNDKGNSLYLSIVSTETQSLSIITRYRQLINKFENLGIISSSDCINLKPGLVLLVSHTNSSKSKIEAAISKAKTHVPDSYSRECKVKPDSFLAYNLPYIHSSIFSLPEDTISWTFEDAESELLPLDSDYSFLIEKIYNGKIDNEVEGRQASLFLVDDRGVKQHEILKQCWDFDKAARQNQQITFQCMTGSAANQVIHSIYVFSLSQNSIIFEEPYCQQPMLETESTLSCYEESVDEYGELKLSRKIYALE